MQKLRHRAIVRDTEVLSGRWRFEGTNIPIASLIHDHALRGNSENGQYRYLDLTDSEIRSALTFRFPSLREVGLTVQYVSFTLECECGEEMQHATSWADVDLTCICGREWLVQTSVSVKPMES